MWIDTVRDELILWEKFWGIGLWLDSKQRRLCMYDKSACQGFVRVYAWDALPSNEPRSWGDAMACSPPLLWHALCNKFCLLAVHGPKGTSLFLFLSLFP